MLELYYSHGSLATSFVSSLLLGWGPSPRRLISSEVLKWRSVEKPSQLSIYTRVPQGLLDTSPTGFVLTVLHIIKSCGGKVCVHCDYVDHPKWFAIVLCHVGSESVTEATSTTQRGNTCGARCITGEYCLCYVMNMRHPGWMLLCLLILYDHICTYSYLWMWLDKYFSQVVVYYMITVVYTCNNRGKWP